MRAVKLHITGKVQGVFYRHSAQTQAKQLGITGIARNDSDGSVHIEAVGEEAAINQFIGWARIGPPAAKVDNVGIEDIAPASYQGFEIV